MKALSAAASWPLNVRRVPLLALLGLVLLAGPAYAQRPAAATPGAVSARPADFLPPAFHRSRREALRQQLPAGSVAVLFAAPERNRANDVSFVYHQNPDLYYLSGYDEPDAVLVLFKEPRPVGGQAGITEALFTRPRDPQREQWTGRRLGRDGAKNQLQFQFAADNKDFAGAGIKWADFSQILFLDLPTDTRNDPKDPADLYDLVATFRQQAGVPADYNAERQATLRTMQKHGLNNAPQVAAYLSSLSQEVPAAAADPIIQNYLAAKTDAERRQVLAAIVPGRHDGATLGAALDGLREIKQPQELTLLRRAIQISTAGQREVFKLVRPDMGEMEIQGLHEYVYRRFGAEAQGYPSIVGAGANGCILHYEANDRQRLDNDLLLMDCGAEYHGYSADVTRTVPPGGTFSPAQRQIYELVLAAQEAGFRECKGGREFNAPNKATQEIITAGLLRLGIIKDPRETRRYYPHGASHYLGLDVHDRGTYGSLRPGTVITVEPGIYIPAGSPCDAKWWNIGVRIEDDVLITEQGYENLSAGAPRTVAEIEQLMAEPSALEAFKLPALR
ncbi:aminopeptidase P N-terminal domain-containing protein [uncultured Hymenobacter sp.]|uniref:aminopeptidase P N-terminal domain-containing protein n=1 Tax=uncultured Hymenobacter sp. TaxID=170016 RepID=UPI0035CA2AB0